jgi:hypothetical protein
MKRRAARDHAIAARVPDTSLADVLVAHLVVAK